MATMRAAQMSTQDENSVLVQAMGGGGGLGGGSGLTKPAARAFGTSLGSGGKASTGLQKPARKALGNITNQTSRRALGDITNNVKPAPQAPNVKPQSVAAPEVTRRDNDIFTWAAEGVEQLAGKSGRQQDADRQLASTQDAVRRADWLLAGAGSMPRAPGQSHASQELASKPLPDMLHAPPIHSQQAPICDPSAAAMEFEVDDAPEPTEEPCARLCVTLALPTA